MFIVGYTYAIIESSILTCMVDTAATLAVKFLIYKRNWNNNVSIEKRQRSLRAFHTNITKWHPLSTSFIKKQAHKERHTAKARMALFLARGEEELACACGFTCCMVSWFHGVGNDLSCWCVTECWWLSSWWDLGPRFFFYEEEWVLRTCWDICTPSLEITQGVGFGGSFSTDN